MAKLRINKKDWQKNNFLYIDKDDYKNYLYSGIVGKIEKIFINFIKVRQTFIHSSFSF